MIKPKEINLDIILSELGEYGLFHIILNTLFVLPILFLPIFSLRYIFTTSPLDHRSIMTFS